ncbi:MAG: hypothetical protein KTR26_19650 [Flammeovirgaceae bacterium]|nr:hypothetical protein [Flammeovirgaceae bacterium]
MRKVNYPSRLLRIESGQQFTNGEISLFESGANYKRDLAEKVDKAINKILELNESPDGGTYSIEFPKGINHNVSKEIKSKVVKELTAYEVRTFTAIVALAQLAKARSELYYLEKINRAYFEFTIPQIHRLMGIGKGKSNIDKELVKKALLSLHRKEFIYNEGDKFVISPLIQIHSISDTKKRKGSGMWDGVLNITIDSCFFDFAQTKAQTYFQIPLDLNENLRKVNKGRPNASVEILIKYLYQSKHCSSSNKVEYNYDKLVDIMKLNRHIKNNNHKRIKSTIDKGFETAINIGLLEKVEEGTNVFNELKYVIYFK